MTENKKRKIALAIYSVEEERGNKADYHALHVYLSKHCWNRWGSPALVHVMPEISEDGKGILLVLTPAAVRGEDVWKVGGKPDQKLIQVRLPEEFDWPTFGKTEAWALVDYKGSLGIEYIVPDPEQEPETGEQSGEDVAAPEPPATDGLPYGDDPPSGPPANGKDPLWAIVAKLEKLINGLAAGTERASGGMPQVERDGLMIAELKARADHMDAVEEHNNTSHEFFEREIVAIESIAESLKTLVTNADRVLEYGMPLDTSGLKDA